MDAPSISGDESQRVKSDSFAFDVPLPAAVLNIDEKLRSNLFSWRGQFSPQLVESLLRAYTEPAMTILDPFMGSGTVLIEAARHGNAVYGTEVNPAAYAIARLYEYCSLPNSVRTRDIEQADDVIDQILGSGLPLFPRVNTTGVTSLPAAAIAMKNARVKALLEAVVVLSDSSDQHEKATTYRQCWREIKTTIAGLPLTDKPVRASLGDARRLELNDRYVDFVLTSPPYINVFNYHHNYRSSVEILGWQPLVVAKSEIGSNRKFRQNRFLTVVQYCIDMTMTLAEIRRVGTHDMRAIFVVGRESNVHKTPFFNSEIVSEAARHFAGFHVTQKQQRVFTNRFGQLIFEDLLHFEARSQPLPSDEIVSEARDFARTVLSDARQRVPDDRLKYLDDALAAASQICPFPLLVPLATRSAGLAP